MGRRRRHDNPFAERRARELGLRRWMTRAELAAEAAAAAAAAAAAEREALPLWLTPAERERRAVLWRLECFLRRWLPPDRVAEAFALASGGAPMRPELSPAETAFLAAERARWKTS